MILQVLIALVTGWVNRHQQQVISYLQAENRVLKSKLPGGRLRLSDTERRRLGFLPTFGEAGAMPLAVPAPPRRPAGVARVVGRAGSGG